MSHNFEESELEGLTEAEKGEEISVDELIRLVQERADSNSPCRRKGILSTPRSLTLEVNNPALILHNANVDVISDDLQDNDDLDIAASLTNNEKSRKRKRKANKSTWKREIVKQKRMKGEEYSGYETKRDSETDKRVFKEGSVARNARRIGSPCRSRYCALRKDYNCQDFTEDQRTEIFDNFWKNFDWNEKKAYISSLVDSVPIKQKSTNTLGRRKDTFIYYLKLNDKKVQVCRHMFLSTLSLGYRQVYGWVRPNCKTAVTPPSDEGTSRRKESTRHAVEFINSLPKVPSHYCRSSSTKLYLEPCINSKNQLYELYQKHCDENGLLKSSKTQFSRIIEEINVGIFMPRKDLCDTCEGYKAGNISDLTYEEHIKKKKLAHEAKRIDKQAAFEQKCHVLTMDLQAVKLSPFLKASALYYKTKLMVHNFTIYNLKTKEVLCYVWDESEGDLSASTFTSCVIDFLENYLPKDNLPIIIYSDGCTYQNRNAIIGNALLELSVKQKREIQQKFLEKGHTYMECDSAHSAIESELKGKSIFVPNDYVKIISDARIKKPYLVKFLAFDFFKDFSMKKFQRFASIRPGEKKGDPCVTDLRNIRYSPLGKISYRLSYDDSEWTELKSKSRIINTPEYPQLFSARLKIPARKFMDLQSLKSVIPEEYHSFYDMLPHNI